MNSLVRLARWPCGRHADLEDHPPDFRVRRMERGRWKVDAASDRARAWAERNVNFDHYDETAMAVLTDLAGANSLAHRARMAGFSLEYVGPIETVKL